MITAGGDRGRHPQLVSLQPVKHLSSFTACSRMLQRGRAAQAGEEKEVGVLLTSLVIVVVSAALVAGAAWGVYGNLPPKVERYSVALAGGALMCPRCSS